MTHKPIVFRDVSLVWPERVCFSGLSVSIFHGQRIAIIGDNGAGKSTLLKMLLKEKLPSSGEIFLPPGIHFGYVPQIVEVLRTLSLGQTLNSLLRQSLSKDPNLLILDEPTNHLDQKNRAMLMRIVHQFCHTLVVATHDEQLLRSGFDMIIDIAKGKARVFCGGFDEYQRELDNERASLLQAKNMLNKAAKQAHQALMQEQARAKSSRLMGEKNVEHNKWPTLVSKAKVRRAEETTGRKKKELIDKRSAISQKLLELKQPEVITPHFHLAAPSTKNGAVISVIGGSVGYEQCVIDEIYLTVLPSDRVALMGDNGSGKSTLCKAFINAPTVKRIGDWRVIDHHEIGYLDQGYKNLDYKKTVLANIWDARPDFTLSQCRHHLNDFLFRKNECVNKLVSMLSGGELMRLSLCLIACRTPRLLILDEITNNVDLTTKNHIITVLNHYPGALLLISHDQEFVKSINITRFFLVEGARLREV